MAAGKSSKRSIPISIIVDRRNIVGCGISASHSRRRSDTGGSGACRLSSTERRATATLGHVRSKVR